jgi:two-component system, NarL family, captular synthesis response regulator RcsB
VDHTISSYARPRNILVQVRILVQNNPYAQPAHLTAPRMQRLRIVIADDHPLVLMAMTDLLHKDLSFDVVATLGTPTALVEQLARDQPHVVITDYSMPGDEIYGDGIRLIKYLIRHYADTRIVVLTMVSNPMIISALYDAGVDAVVFKHDNLGEIVTALHALQLGRKYYPPGFQRDGTLAARSKFIGERINSLSPKEFEVLRHFIRGESMMQVADSLKRSVKTVSGQKISAMRKLNVQTDQELVTFCVESGMFQ